MARDPYRQAAHRIDRLAAAAKRGADAAEGEAADTFASLARGFAPKLTGALARSITPHEDGTVSIESADETSGSPERYYSIVETGGEAGPGSHQAPSPFLRPAAALTAAALPAIARREVARAVQIEARRQGGR
ncbi:MAG: hypothetical protein ACR2JF_03385 [Iamia sp.]